ncbi:hypothetical protein Y032_0600g490 [Ancylostoma ceylanicum]|uniref:Uncharacterized protein n=1 Tax=Ancylostoma ceylanicum TaxID=53326 RepID=A0A016WM30_9BILA|nr:hypothetical protein Y032_0600g490 [Ancylostoma ceylanicum]
MLSVFRDFFLLHDWLFESVQQHIYTLSNATIVEYSCTVSVFSAPYPIGVLFPVLFFSAAFPQLSSQMKQIIA